MNNKVKIDGVVYERLDGYQNHDIHNIPEIGTYIREKAGTFEHPKMPETAFYKSVEIWYFDENEIFDHHINCAGTWNTEEGYKDDLFRLKDTSSKNLPPKQVVMPEGSYEKFVHSRGVDVPEKPSLSEIRLALGIVNVHREYPELLEATKTILYTKSDKYYYTTLNMLLKKENSTAMHYERLKEKCERLGLQLPENEGVRTKWKDNSPAHYFYETNQIYEYDLSKGEFPLTTFRPQAWENAIKEIFWIYQDQSNDLNLLETKYGIKWWEPWNIGNKTIGQRYGATVKEYDLLNNTLRTLKEDPMDRRNIMDMLQYTDLKKTPGLFPCCYSTTWNVRGEYLDVIVNQRSSDFATAWSINQIQYVALQMMLAKAAGLKPGKFTHVVGNVHIYDRHLDACELLASRTPTIGKNPILKFEPKTDDFYSFSINDFSVEEYEPHPEQIKLEIAI